MNNSKYSHPSVSTGDWFQEPPALAPATCNIMNKSHKHNVSHEKPDTNEYTL